MRVWSLTITLMNLWGAFLKKDKVSTLLWLLALQFHYQKKDCNTESIFLNIPSHSASRPTIYKPIDTAISKGHIRKRQNEKHHRIVVIYFLHRQPLMNLTEIGN